MPHIEDEQSVYKSGRFRVVRLRVDINGKKTEYDQVVMGEGIALVVLDRQENVFMVREWRSTVNDYIVQIPGGYAGDEDEEVLAEAARREAREELGLVEISSLKKLKSFMPVGGMRGKLHIFYIDNVDQDLSQDLESTEDVEVLKIPLDEAYRRFVLGDELTTSATIIGLALVVAMRHRDK
ncbi:MAG: NUDIX domain-containing protein [Candidatus Chisholmbacteria bacterium]|nr:NUDIX domain-containing protein [Candidatus Chisholmbacteria bacterium]